MTDEPDNIVLIYLRRMEAKLDRLLDDMRDLKVRVTSLEENQAGLQRRMDVSRCASTGSSAGSTSWMRPEITA